MTLYGGIGLYYVCIIIGHLVILLYCRTQSSCEITLEPPKPGVAERIITIMGTANGIQFAQQLMQNRLEYTIYVKAL